MSSEGSGKVASAPVGSSSAAVASAAGRTAEVPRCCRLALVAVRLSATAVVKIEIFSGSVGRREGLMA
jgi:hypothetical protein